MCGGLNLVIGPNGAGKTTLLKVVAGLVRPTRGVIHIDGHPPLKSRDRISYVPAHFATDPLARVIDVADSMNYGKGPGWRDSLRKYLQKLGVGWAEERRMSTLSSGEQRLALLAAALSREPEILIADEPTAYLDLGNQARVFSLLKGLTRDGVLVIAATHDVNFVKAADRVLLLDGGREAYFGDPDGLGCELLSKAYGVRVSLGEGLTASLWERF